MKRLCFLERPRGRSFSDAQDKKQTPPTGVVPGRVPAGRQRERERAMPAKDVASIRQRRRVPPEIDTFLLAAARRASSNEKFA